MKIFFIFFWILIFLFPLSSLAEGNHTLTPLTPSLLGIIGGRPKLPPNTNDAFAKNLVYIQTSDDTGEGFCTGFIVDGCVITAKHCGQLKNTKIFWGYQPNLKGKEFVRMQKRVIREGGKQHDIAILKLEGALPQGKGLPRSVLSKEKLPASLNKPVEIAGYGYYGTQETKDLKRKNYGEGTRRFGVASLEGYKNFDGQNLTEGKAVMVINRAFPDKQIGQISAEGDSGGPLIFNNKIYGTCISVLGEDMLPPNNIKLFYKAEDIHTAVYTVMADQISWINKNLDALGCGKE